MMVNDDMVGAYISAHTSRAYGPEGRGISDRDAVRRGIEAALGAEAFGLRRALTQTRWVLSLIHI